MTINVKYGIHSKVWTVRNCKAVESEVLGISVFESGVYYRISSDSALFKSETVAENECFATKLELLEHIKNG